MQMIPYYTLLNKTFLTKVVENSAPEVLSLGLPEHRMVVSGGDRLISRKQSILFFSIKNRRENIDQRPSKGNSGESVHGTDMLFYKDTVKSSKLETNKRFSVSLYFGLVHI